MAKPEWGVKRQCNSCGSRFYDLNRTPIVCPKCGAAYEGEQTFKTRRSSAALEKVQAVKAAVAALDDDSIIALEDEDELESVVESAEEEDESLIEDASDLGEDDDDMAEVMEHLDEEGGDEA